jgi:hypothetical protein
VQRDPDKWWKSMRKVMDMGYNPIVPILVWPAPGVRWFPQHLYAWRRFVDRQLAEAGKEMGPGQRPHPLIQAQARTKRTN